MYFYQLEDLSVRDCPFGTVLYSNQDLQNATAVMLTRSCSSFLCLYMKEGLRGDYFLIATEDDAFESYLFRYFEVAGAPILEYDLKNLSFKEWLFRLDKNHLLQENFVKDTLQQMGLAPLIDFAKKRPIVNDFRIPLENLQVTPNLAEIFEDDDFGQDDAYYLISDNDEKKRKDYMFSLLDKLYQKGRLKTNRITLFSLGKLIKEGGYGIDKLKNIYKTNRNGAVIMGVPNLPACQHQPWWEVFYTEVTTHQPDVVTIFYSDDRLMIDQRLTSLFLPHKLQVIKEGLPEKIKKTPRKEKAPREAYQELQKMVGLDEVKEILDGFINYQKFSKIRAERGLVQEAPVKHMVFTGNPGTAKTTVARLIGEILKDEGILEVGDFYEVGRGDLVGQYVGHTAPIIQGQFKKAQGSVLFIDEAYSLVDDGNRTFAAEAINTIVAEMENHREDVMVIFAGYPKEMAEFIHQNPGLKSRLPYEINFPDYSFDELFEIGQLEAKKRSYQLTEDSKDAFIKRLEKDKKADPEHFGNGRNARNLIEEGGMALAKRILEKDLTTVTNEDLMKFLPEDFSQFKRKSSATNEKTIGFFH